MNATNNRFCVNCKWFTPTPYRYENADYVDYRCTSPTTLITGPVLGGSRYPHSCGDMRGEYVPNQCGKAGLLFEPAPPKPAATPPAKSRICEEEECDCGMNAHQSWAFAACVIAVVVSFFVCVIAYRP